MEGDGWKVIGCPEKLIGCSKVPRYINIKHVSFVAALVALYASNRRTLHNHACSRTTAAYSIHSTLRSMRTCPPACQLYAPFCDLLRNTLETPTHGSVETFAFGQCISDAVITPPGVSVRQKKTCKPAVFVPQGFSKAPSRPAISSFLLVTAAGFIFNFLRCGCLILLGTQSQMRIVDDICNVDHNPSSTSPCTLPQLLGLGCRCNYIP